MRFLRALHQMAHSTVLEGVFAVRKPPNISSAQVLRDLQQTFRVSQTFAPLLQETRKIQAENDRHQGKRRRRDDDSPFKMGHGGTLDPMATGVLIVGIGRGTKHLQNFLGCTKQYDTVVLFGKSTDTYDVAGKVVLEAPHSHITENAVRVGLESFKGHIKQVPPIYSALKINGMKAYEYARSGRELPRELESRDMDVDECVLLDYYQPGTHDFRWPAQQADAEEKAAVQKLLKIEAKTVVATEGTMADIPPTPEDRSHDKDGGQAHSAREAEARASSESTLPIDPKRNDLSPSAKQALHVHEISTSHLSSTPASAPAASVRLTVSSGFYVRSFAHDLGISLDSYGTMASLVRVRQGNYTLDPSPPSDMTSALTYEDFEKGEEHWGPTITRVLSTWMELNPVVLNRDKVDDRDRTDRTGTGASRHNSKHAGNWRGRGRGRDRGRGRGHGYGNQRSSHTHDHHNGEDVSEEQKRPRRNSSSPE